MQVRQKEIPRFQSYENIITFRYGTFCFPINDVFPWKVGGHHPIKLYSEVASIIFQTASYLRISSSVACSCVSQCTAAADKGILFC